jgi:hypothetical protein
VNWPGTETLCALGASCNPKSVLKKQTQSLAFGRKYKALNPESQIASRVGEHDSAKQTQFQTQ